MRDQGDVEAAADAFLKEYLPKHEVYQAEAAALGGLVDAVAEVTDGGFQDPCLHELAWQTALALGVSWGPVWTQWLRSPMVGLKQRLLMPGLTDSAGSWSGYIL